MGKFSTGQYVSGIFYLLNRGINVRIDKDADKYEAITLAQVRPDAKPYVSDDTFGKMLKKGLSGKASKLDNVAKDSVKKQMSGSDNTPSGLISKFLSSPAMALTALSNLFKSGPGALLDKAKDKAKGFLGEERYNAVADKLGSLKDRVIGDERYQNLKANAQEKLDALKDKASEAGNKIGHTRVVNNMAYAADSLKLRSAEDTAAHYKSDDEHDNIRAAAIKGLCEKGKFDIAEDFYHSVDSPADRHPLLSNDVFHKDGRCLSGNRDRMPHGEANRCFLHIFPRNHHRVHHHSKSVSFRFPYPYRIRTELLLSNEYQKK